MSEAKLLRALADKIDDLDAVKAFPADVTDPGTVTVSWSAGSDHEGYQALSDAIGALVKQHWNALRSQVVKQRETEVQAARTAWSAMTKAANDVQASASAPAAETGGRETSVRKAAG